MSADIKESVTKKFEASDKELSNVLGFVEGKLEEHDCNMKTQMMIAVMVEEIFVNIAHYAYEGKVGYADLDLEFSGDNVSIRFTDSGIAFDPLAKEDPDITLSADERKIGGLGIFMVKKTMDDVTYQRVDDKNILTIVKNIH